MHSHHECQGWSSRALTCRVLWGCRIDPRTLGAGWMSSWQWYYSSLQNKGVSESIMLGVALLMKNADLLPSFWTWASFQTQNSQERTLPHHKKHTQQGLSNSVPNETPGSFTTITGHWGRGTTRYFKDCWLGDPKLPYDPLAWGYLKPENKFWRKSQLRMGPLGSRTNSGVIFPVSECVLRRKSS